MSCSSQTILIGSCAACPTSGGLRPIRPRNVSRTNTIYCGINAVKSRNVRVFDSLSLADTELAEHDIEQILDADPASDTAKRPHRLAQFLGRKLGCAGARIAIERDARGFECL